MVVVFADDEAKWSYLSGLCAACGRARGRSGDGLPANAIGRLPSITSRTARGWIPSCSSGCAIKATRFRSVKASGHVDLRLIQR